MGIVALDYETFYDHDYTLTRMTQADYILHPRFEIIMCAVKEDDGPSELFVGEQAIRERFASIDWDATAMLSHNCSFDAGIMAWRLGIVPAFYLDTMSMSRALLYHALGSSSLKEVAGYFKLPAKGEQVHQYKGWGLRDFLAQPEHLANYGNYCKHDNELCRTIYDRLMAFFPASELPVIDATVRMFCAPQVRLNPHILAAHLAEVRARKAATLAKVAHVGPEVFASSAMFAELLTSRGVEVPMKTSPATGKEIPALAKNDRAFKELCSDADQTEEVQALLAARLGAKSTLEETRTERMLSLSLKQWPDGDSGWAPVPLRYYGAHTGRFAGFDKQNWQNINRLSRIREAIEAPEGFRILHRDSSQIEARMNAWLAGCEGLLTAFRDGRDIYSEFATEFYGRTITKADKPERFVGKTSILGLGYGMGVMKFMHTLFIGQGGISVKVTPEEASRLVSMYRTRFEEIPVLWNKCEQMLRAIVPGSKLQCPPIKPCIRTGSEVVWLPNNMPLNYRNVRKIKVDRSSSDMVYDGPHGTPRKLFGGKVTENLCQALARIVITETMTRVKAITGWSPFMQTHDSLDYCVPVEEVELMDRILDAEFARAPAWAPGLPLASEGGWGTSLKHAEDRTNQ